MLKAKIRGIYTTALTKLFLNNGFTIVQPSLAIKKRFNLKDNLETPDVSIKDRHNLQGIKILGTSEAVDKCQSLLHSSFEDVLTREWNASVDGIYVGRIVGSEGDFVLVEIGEGIIGKLSQHELKSSEGGCLLVQVERKRMGFKHPILSIDLKIVGKYAILVKSLKGGVSFRVRDLKKRAELSALGRALALDGWSIIWRESCINQPKEELEKEVRNLIEKAKKIYEEKLDDSPKLLLSGSQFMDVEFPWHSKKSLDELRASVAHTLSKHHFYKSCGGEVSTYLEMAEDLLEEGHDKTDTEKCFQEQISRKFPSKDSIIEVEHVKPSGIVFYLGSAKIETFAEDFLEYSRTIRGNGVYDGLGVPKETGDKAISMTRIGEWSITTRYYSSNGELKGTYVNLNTPVEIYPWGLRYVDLEVDVCILPDGTRRVLDMEKLEKVYEKGIISEKLLIKVKSILKGFM